MRAWFSGSGESRRIGQALRTSGYVLVPRDQRGSVDTRAGTARSGGHAASLQKIRRRWAVLCARNRFRRKPRKRDARASQRYEHAVSRHGRGLDAIACRVVFRARVRFRRSFSPEFFLYRRQSQFRNADRPAEKPVAAGGVCGTVAAHIWREKHGNGGDGSPRRAGPQRGNHFHRGRAHGRCGCRRKAAHTGVFRAGHVSFCAQLVAHFWRARRFVAQQQRIHEPATSAGGQCHNRGFRSA